MMCSRSRLAVAVWCALFAVALSATIEPGSNSIDAGTTIPGKPSTQKEKPELVTDPPSKDGSHSHCKHPKKPLNERYPHAVLFGETCGGTIISPTWVITAAHCTIFTPGDMVLAGTNNSGNDSGVKRKIKRLILHPLFTVGPYWVNAKDFNLKQVSARWDFMLAELEEPLDLNDKSIKAAKLDGGPTFRSDIQVAFAGFGAEHHGEVMRHDMHAIQLQTIDDIECKKKLIEYNPEDMLCTRGRPPRNDTACNGDSGSGLVDQNRYLLGVASWVENDAFECKNGNIVVFSRISSVREWIRSVTGI